MSGPLHDCPKCGTKNFTARGLKAHNCERHQLRAKALAGHLAHQAEEKAALTVVPEKLPALDQAEMARQFTEQYQRAANAMPEVLKFGAMVLIVEKVIHDGSLSLGRGKKGGLREWMRTHAPDVPLANALRFRDVVLGIAKEYEQLVGPKVAKQFALPELVTADGKTLPADALKKRDELFSYVAGTSQKSWLDKFRPVKARGGPRVKDPDKTYDPNAPVENARDLLLHPLRTIAIRWREKEAKLPLWSHLPPAELREIDNILLDLRNDLKAALREKAAPKGPQI